MTITGTGCPILDPDRAGPGVLVSVVDGEANTCQLQVDAGRSTVPRLAALGLSPMDLDAVLLTHYHSDHLLGLQDVVLSHWIVDSDDDGSLLEVVAPNGATRRFCDRMIDIWSEDLGVRGAHNGRSPEPKFEVVGFDTPNVPTEVWSRGSIRVLAGPVRHEPVVGAVGYRVETPAGVVAISGDTKVCPELATLAEGADVVVYEAMRMDVINQRRPDRRHITEYHADTRLIGRQMAELEIPTLMLSHLIPPPSTASEKQLFVDEVREGGYVGDVIVCDDLDAVTLR